MADKTHLLRALDQERDDLWALLDALPDDKEIYPGWCKREFFAHIAGWEAYIFDMFRDYAAGRPFKTYPYNGLRDVDSANNAFVAERQAITLEGAKLECEINRFAIKTLLADIPERDFDNRLTVPWGEESLAQWMAGAIEHERSHGADIRALIK